MSSRFTVDTNILRIRDVFAINPQNSQFIQPGEIPMIGSNGQLRWYSSLEFFSSISVPTASTSVLGILLSVPEGLSSLSTAITTVTNDTVTSTVRGLGSSDYVSTSYLENVIVLLSQDRKYISATTLYDVIANLGNLPWIGDNGGPMALLGSNFASNSGYISTFSLFSTVAGLGSLGYLSTGGISFQTALASTVVGLGTVGYVSTAVSPLQLQSTVEGLGAAGIVLNSSISGFYASPVRFFQGSGASATVPAKGAQNVLGYSVSTSEIFYSDSLQLSSIYTQFGFSSNGIWATSDSNVKENIVNADLAICYSNVSTLPLRRFNFISPFAETKIDKNQVGFIAQELSTIFPKSLVTTYDILTSTNILQINYDQINMAHYGATQLMMSTVSGQQKQINDLAATVSSLVAKVGL
jgi:hypothetical protein